MGEQKIVTIKDAIILAPLSLSFPPEIKGKSIRHNRSK